MVVAVVVILVDVEAEGLLISFAPVLFVFVVVLLEELDGGWLFVAELIDSLAAAFDAFIEVVLLMLWF